jgi:hypothetical protein
MLEATDNKKERRQAGKVGAEANPYEGAVSRLNAGP